MDIVLKILAVYPNFNICFFKFDGAVFKLFGCEFEKKIFLENHYIKKTNFVGDISDA